MMCDSLNCLVFAFSVPHARMRWGIRDSFASLRHAAYLDEMCAWFSRRVRAVQASSKRLALSRKRNERKQPAIHKHELQCGDTAVCRGPWRLGKHTKPGGRPTGKAPSDRG
ncbi:hypothetical protein MRX96_026885 [Rhipicephalus microplus]